MTNTKRNAAPNTRYVEAQISVTPLGASKDSTEREQDARTILGHMGWKATDHIDTIGDTLLFLCWLPLDFYNAAADGGTYSLRVGGPDGHDVDIEVCERHEDNDEENASHE